MRFVIFAFSSLVLFNLSLPARADIVDVVGGGSASFSGSITALCFFAPCQVDTEAFGQSGSADDGRVTMTGTFSDNTNVSSTSINAEVDTSVNVQAVGAEWGAESIVSSQFAFDFTLTTASILDLTQNFDGALLSLQGPGTFDSSLLSANVDQLFTLMPGTYTLNVDSFGSMFPFSPQGFFTDETFEDDFLLSADFTPAVPEPRWTLIPLLLAMARCVYRRRRGFPSS